MEKLFDCNHPKVEQFVRNEVIICASSLVAEILSKNETEDFYHLMGTDNYESAVLDNLDEEDTKAVLEDYGVDSLDDLDSEDYQNIANEYNIDPYYEEVFEYWAVSNFLAKELQERGEIVEKDFFGINVWGRCTTGQSITLDYVIRSIVTDLHNKVEAWSNDPKATLV